jgi:hypothetical protein
MLNLGFSRALVAVFVTFGLVCQGTSVLAGTTGTLSLTVTDSATGHPLVGAKVTAASPSQTATGTTDSSGHLSFLALAPDTYVVSVEAQGYEAQSVTGTTVVADNSRTVALLLVKNLHLIGRVTARAASSLVRPGTTVDVYSINAATQDKEAAAGGGGTLNSAFSALSTVAGVFVSPGQAGYIGAGAELSIRGGDYDQIGYEIDGVPVNRSFDNYQSGPASSLGQQELQVYTGTPPANAQSSGLSGFINQVIRTGTTPGFVDVDTGLGGPSYYHKIAFEFGGATPSRNFSYYVGIGGYDQDYRYGDQFNGASLSNTYGIPLAPCSLTSTGAPAISRSVAPSCYAPNGAYYGNTALANATGASAYVLGPFNYGQQASVQDRDNVVNLHFGLPQKNGTRDDIQVLGMVNSILDYGYSSLNDAGGAALLNAIGISTTYPDSYGYRSPTGVPLQSNPGSLISNSYFPNTPSHGFDAPIPANLEDGGQNDQSIFKLQYTHEMGNNALFKVYGYSYYSDWDVGAGPNGANADYFAYSAPDYELSSHSRGLSGSFIDQITPTNLLNFTASAVTSNTLRMNNFQYLDGGTTISPFNPLAVLVNANNPTNGYCYTATGAVTTCTPTFGAPAQWATLQQAAIPGTGIGGTSIPLITAASCGGGPCEYYVVGNGQQATYSQVKPLFDNFSLTDEWHPTSKITVNAGLKLDEFAFQGSDTQGTPARALFYNAFNIDYCQDSSGDLYDKVLNEGAKSPTVSCSSLGLSPVNLTNPTGTVTESYSEFQPRLGTTYSLDPQTVLRASYGRYAQPPSSAFEQYNGLEADTPQYPIGGTGSFAPFGFTTPDHVIGPEVSNNYDFSLEHQFNGGVSMKLTPFLRLTQGQIQNFYLDQKQNFVSGLNVGKQTSRGVEFELDKGSFERPGLSARLTFAYTNSFINYETLSNGETVVSGINALISNYNAYTSACAPGAKLAGTSHCGSTASGAVAAPCYTPAGAAAACAPGDVANPYWNAPAQALINPNDNFPTFDTLPSGIGSAVDAYGAPYTLNLTLNEKVGRFSIAPIVQMFAGQRYGAPETTWGVQPDTCAVLPGASVTGDPRYPYGAAGGTPFNANTCTGTVGIPNPYTKAFDGIGAFVEPSQLQLHAQITYQASNRVTFVANFTNLINSCFGGTKVPWSVPGVCTYNVLGNGDGGDVGNLYNPGQAIQPYVNTPYEPGLAGGGGGENLGTAFPFGVYVNARIKL